jgi:asparagine synthase (glutamine-hydrolysing)
MYFVALLWDESDAVRSRTAGELQRRFCLESPDWKVTVNEPGLSVVCLPRANSRVDEICTLPERRGVVLGKLFETSYIPREAEESNAPASVTFSEAQGQLISDSGCRHLLEHYWGHYVAFVREPEGRKRWVLRDPSGGQPCQWTRIQGIDIYFVRIDDCERLARLQLTLNLKYLLGYLVYGNSAVRQTPFREVESVLPGECIEHSPRGRRNDFVWSSLQVSQFGCVESLEEAVHLTRNTVRACVHAWASCFDGVLLSLSGGLDSSIVAACLKEAPTRPKVLARNFYFEGPSADEREFARLAARHSGFELMECEVPTQYAPTSIRHAVRSLFPVAWPIDPDALPRERAFFASRELDAEFRGHGGDEIFFRGGRFGTAVDFAWHHGASPSVLPIALDDAALVHASIWQILRQVYRYGVRRAKWHPRRINTSGRTPLITSEARKEAGMDPDCWHPLFRDESNIPPGKYEQAFVLTYATCRAFDPLLPDDGPVRLSPLLSQPLIELSLRTPLHVLRAAGRDRAVARMAFAADLPSEIVNRSSKAFGTSRFRQIIENHLPFLRELLLDGLLVREGIVNRTGLESALSSSISRSPAHVVEICDYVTVENWARCWPAMQSTCAATTIQEPTYVPMTPVPELRSSAP